MRRPLLCLGFSLVVMASLYGLAACSNDKSSTNAGATGGQGGQPSMGDCKAGAPSESHVLIDDMETTDHGPIQLTAGIAAPLTPGYWYNSGANYLADAGVDMSNPPQGSFLFSALATPTTTLGCKSSAHGAHQSCTLNGLYDTCGVGFEFAQQPAPDAGAPNPSDPTSGPKVTVPFDISRYKAVTFWGMTTTPDPSGSLQVKVSFPDTDTDPRGQICNGGGGNTSKCYNSYAALLNFTTTWQQFTVKLDAGMPGMPAVGGIAIDPSWGYQQAQWIPTKVYGINWQAQKNTAPDAGPPLMTDIWVDDVYFIE